MVLVSVAVHSNKNDIEVDRFSSEDIVPFHVGKFRYSFGNEHFEFREFKVEGMILDHFPCNFLARKVSSVDSYTSQGKSDSSGARLLADDP